VSSPEAEKRNVFLMIRFRDSPEHKAITTAIDSKLADYGLVLVRADWEVDHPELFANVRLRMDDAQYGIAVFEQIAGEPVSPNVGLELGYMLAKDKRCLLLRERGMPALPADLAGHLCREFDVVQVERTVGSAVHEWLQDLGLAKRPNERMLVYISHGGTCRDPMAKAITQKLLDEREPDLDVHVEAMAMGPPSKGEASFGAREAIRRTYGEDLLADHVPRQITARIEQEADLILVMSERLLNPKSAAAEKTDVFKPFFGREGDVEDPWPDGRDEAAVARYTACCSELKEILERDFARLLEALTTSPGDPDRAPHRS
jgi:protein-tyrosine-phosphatase